MQNYFSNSYLLQVQGFLVMKNSVNLNINCSKIEKKIIEFIIKTNENAGVNGAVIGLSGGIDSSVTLALTVKALGPENVTVLTLPERDITLSSDIIDVMSLCKQLNLTCNTVDITPILHVIQNTIPLYDYDNRISNGNVKARTRMIILYYYANILNKLVIGTSNKSELLTGFFTKYGDGAVDIMPLGDLYKTQIRQLAQYLNIPKSIIDKPPSPGFFSGQTDEGELGIDYSTLDLILYLLEKDFTKKQISENINVPISKVESIINRVNANEHKRRPPLILRLS